MMDLMEQMERNDNRIGELIERQSNSGCLHEALEESNPINHKGGAHNLVCPCPKCSFMC